MIITLTSSLLQKIPPLTGWIRSWQYLSITGLVYNPCLTVIPLAVSPAVVPALVPGELLARRAEGRPVGALSARVAAHGPAVDGARDAARRVQQPVVIVTTSLGWGGQLCKYANM